MAAGASTLITTVSALAVTGALQQMQRNHGVMLVAAFGAVLVAAAIWVALTLWTSSAAAKPATQEGSLATLQADLAATILDAADLLTRLTETMERAKGTLEGSPRFPRVAKFWRWVWTHRHGVAEFVALGFFVGGIVTGVWGMIITQQAQERPSVTASVDPKTLLLSVKATAHNLGTEDRMVTEVDGLTRSQQPDGSFAFKEDVRYLTLTGPDAGGTATQEFAYTIPAGYVAVPVSATTGNQISCQWDETLAARESPKPRAPVRDVTLAPKQHTLPGCALIYLPAAATAG